MLRITPKCSLDLTGLQPDFIVRIAGKSFPTYRFLLITQSDFFRKLLTSGFKERELKEYNFATGDPSLFALIIKTIQGESFDLPDLQTALSYLVYINYFQIKDVDPLQILGDLQIAQDQFTIFIEALDKLYPEGFSQEIVDIIASKMAPTTPLEGFSPELKDAIVNSEKYVYPGTEHHLTQKIWEIVQRHKNDPVKYFLYRDEELLENRDEGIAARSWAEAYLKMRKFFYLKDLQLFPKDLTSQEDFKQNHDFFREVALDIEEGMGLDINIISLNELEALLKIIDDEHDPPLFVASEFSIQ